MKKLLQFLSVASILFVGASFSSCSDKEDMAMMVEFEKIQAVEMENKVEESAPKVQTIEDKMKEVEALERK